jgi:hypothetical protein
MHGVVRINIMLLRLNRLKRDTTRFTRSSPHLNTAPLGSRGHGENREGWHSVEEEVVYFLESTSSDESHVSLIQRYRPRAVPC